jgi:hypothetical protein
MSAYFAIISSDGLMFHTNKELLRKKSKFFDAMFEDTCDDAAEHTSIFRAETIARMCDIVESRYDFARRGNIDDQIDLLNALDFYDMKIEMEKHISWADTVFLRERSYAWFLIKTKQLSVINLIDYPDEAIRNQTLSILPEIRWSENHHIISRVLNSTKNSKEEILAAFIVLIKADIYSNEDLMEFVKTYLRDDRLKTGRLIWVVFQLFAFTRYDIPTFVEYVKKM